MGCGASTAKADPSATDKATAVVPTPQQTQPTAATTTTTQSTPAAGTSAAAAAPSQTTPAQATKDAPQEQAVTSEKQTAPKEDAQSAKTLAATAATVTANSTAPAPTHTNTPPPSTNNATPAASSSTTAAAAATPTKLTEAKNDPTTTTTTAATAAKSATPAATATTTAAATAATTATTTAPSSAPKTSTPASPPTSNKPSIAIASSPSTASTTTTTAAANKTTSTTASTTTPVVALSPKPTSAATTTTTTPAKTPVVVAAKTPTNTTNTTTTPAPSASASSSSSSSSSSTAAKTATPAASAATPAAAAAAKPSTTSTTVKPAAAAAAAAAGVVVVGGAAAAAATASSKPSPSPTHASARSTSSDKLDLNLSSRDIESERQDILRRTLVCFNCEDPTLAPLTLCTECHRENAEKEHSRSRSANSSKRAGTEEAGEREVAGMSAQELSLPPVLCQSCDRDLHQFARTAKHPRAPIPFHVGPMRSAAELGLPGSLLPPGLPALYTLLCSNCDLPNISLYCHTCKTLLCTSCARDIHTPKVLRSHIRTKCTVQFIHAEATGINLISPRSMVPPAAATGAASPTMNVSTSKITVNPQLAARPSASSNTNSPLSPSNTKNIKLVATGSASRANSVFIKPVRRIKPKTTEEKDIVPVENPGVQGDVIFLPEVNLTDALREEVLQFRNIINPYDTIGLCQIVQVSCGPSHAAAVTSLGSLFTWGSNLEYQLGVELGEAKESLTPVLVEFERHSPIRQVACGHVHNVALTQSGEVYTWGTGAMGVLGLVSDEDQPTPQLVPLRTPHEHCVYGQEVTAPELDQAGAEEAIYVAAGMRNSGVIVRGRTDGLQLYMWGEASNGQIGNGKLEPQLAPTLVKVHIPENKANPLPELTSLAFGAKHVAVVSNAGDLYTWGCNDCGQLGYLLPSNDGDNISLQLVPKLVPKLFLDGIKTKQVVCGERHTSLITTAGDVYSFGSGETHQLGVLDNVDQFLPVRAVGLGPSASQPPVAHLSVGAAMTAAVNEAGETFLWGWGVEQPLPRLVSGLRGHFVQKVAVGQNDNFSVLTGTAKDLYEWQFDGTPLDAEETHGAYAGEEAEAGDGDGGGGGSGAEEKQGGKGVPLLNKAVRGKKITQLSAGKTHYGLVTADGKLFMWGSHEDGRLGLRLPGGVTMVPRPTELRLRWGVAEVQCAVEHTIARTLDGYVLTWGTGFEGRLGHRKNADVAEPTIVQALVDLGVKAAAVAIGPSNCGVVSTDGKVYLWGAGNAGQIGNDDVLPQFEPCLNEALAQTEVVTQLAIGNEHCLALTKAHTVYVWGSNRFGQLGQGYSYEEEQSSLPLPVTSLNVLSLTPTQIQCGDNVCLILTKAGEIYGWGSGETGQIVKSLPTDSTTEAADDDASSFGAHGDEHSPVRLVFPFQPGGKQKEQKRIVSISVKDINCVCLTEEHTLYTWGWDFGVPTPLSFIPPPSNMNINGSSSAETKNNNNHNNNSTDTTTNNNNNNAQKWEVATLGYRRVLLLT